MMPSRTSESCARICACWLEGNTSMMRLMVEAAEFVCSGGNGKRPGVGGRARGARGGRGLRVGGSRVEDAVGGGGGGIRVQRGERQVAGLGDAQGGLDGFKVAHF